MISKESFQQRRDEVLRRAPGPVLLMGQGHRFRNSPATELPFRQDSNFLYFVGSTEPDAAAILTEERCVLYLPEPEPDDPLWKGVIESWESQAARLGLSEVRSRSRLEADCNALGVRQTLSVPDVEKTAEAARLTHLELAWPLPSGPDALVDAAIAMRRIKTEEEIRELEEAVRITRIAYRLALLATRPGEHEASMAALFDGCLAAHGAVPGYGSILTVHGEVLHNERRIYRLEEGQLFLTDAGAELESGYTCDVTRVWPVSGRFTGRQRAAYNAVLAANQAAIALCRAGVRYRHVHDEASRVLARWLADEGLLRCDPDTSVETGAHAMFFPHGVGHMLGLDVHDLRGFGDRAAYGPGRTRSPLFGTAYLRLDLDLEPGFLVTIEPGFYIVPGILHNPDFRARYRDLVDFDRAESWLGFGGIRIEDDVVVTAGEPRVLTTGIPKDPESLERLVGSGADAIGRFEA
jgi:Xaa-Pro aminopeptidase